MNSDDGLFEMVLQELRDLDNMLEKRQIPLPKPQNAITEHFILPDWADHTNYRIVIVNGEEICVHQDFVDLVTSL